MSAQLRLAVMGALAAAACAKAPLPDEFVVSAPYDVTSMDPHRENTVSNFSVLSNVYEPLTVTDAETRIQPALAESWETPSPDVWILRIRQGVKFHSGRALTAADVVYSLRRLMTDRELKIRAFVLDVAEVDAPGPYTVRVRTHRPTRVLLNKLHFALVVPEGSTTASLDARPDGTGPYRVESWSPDVVRLARFEGYRGAAPSVARARFELDHGDRDVADAMKAGRVHLAQANDALQARLRELTDHDAKWHENIYVKYLGLDTAREVTPHVAAPLNPLRDVRVRRAMHVGLDRLALAAALPNRAAAASQPVLRFIFGFDPQLAVPPPDPPRARALLEQAGYPSGFEAVLHSRARFAAAARLVSAQLAPLGIRLRVVSVPDAEHFAALRRGEYSLWVSRYGCPTGDASDVLENVIHTVDPERRLGSQNDGGFSDPAVDGLIEEAANYESTLDRQAALQRAMRGVMEALPLVPLYTDQDLYVIDRRYAWQPRNDSYIRLSEVTPAR